MTQTRFGARQARLFHWGQGPQARLQLPLLLTVLIAALSLGGCGGGASTRSETAASGHGFGATAQFPVPEEIRPNVDFWRHVYGVWSRGQVAFHDDEHMGVIYEVARLPGPIKGGYTSYQKQWINSKQRAYRSRLRDLETRVRSGQTLSPSDKALAAKFEQAGSIGYVYGAAERLRTQRGLRERFRRGVEISGRYDPAFREIMRSHGVPEDLAYLPHVESSFQTNARSSVGAAGVWQFMPSTGRIFMDVNGTVDERLDPILAADGAARYLSSAHRKLGSWPLAITSYNHGVGGMTKAKATYGDDIGRIVKHYNGRAFKFASRNFYSEFVAAREVARNARSYFPEGVHYEQPWPHDRVVLRDSMPAHHIASHYGVSTASLARLNLHWRKPASKGRASLPSGSTVWLPAGSTRRVASLPPPYSAPVMVASAQRKPTPVAATTRSKAARSEPAVARVEPAKSKAAATKVSARSKPKPEPKVAVKKSKSRKGSGLTKAKYHVVKPQETLYRVAVINGISVGQLRKLNRLGPSDNNIRVGQRLKVGI